VEGTRCLLFGANMDKKYWCEAIVHMTYIRNLIPQGIDKDIPFESLFGRKPDYSRLFKLGSEV